MQENLASMRDAVPVEGRVFLAGNHGLEWSDAEDLGGLCVKAEKGGLNPLKVSDQPEGKLRLAFVAAEGLFLKTTK